jgi:transcriptional regulator with XRE-family HTH domain
MPTDVQPDELVFIFAANVKARRLELGLTQAQLAERLDCHVPYISDLENRRKSPYLGNLAKLAEALETSPDALLAAPENAPPKKARRAS